MVKYNGPVPRTDSDIIAAAVDPLTPEDLLREIASWEEGQYKDVFTSNQYNRFLALNPALPLDLFENFLKSKNASAKGFLIASPLATFEQARTIMEDSFYKDLSHLNSVKELFGFLLDEEENLNIQSHIFLKLIRSPLLSTEDFRTCFNSATFQLPIFRLMNDPRFDIDNVDIERYGISAAMRLCVNPAITTEALLNMTAIAKKNNEVWLQPLKNSKYPIELSAHYHVEHLDSYKWSPSLLVELNTKANEYLELTTGTKHWLDAPLAWKLKMIAE